MSEQNPQSKGGLTRAKNLSSKERSAIAKKAAKARWAKKEERATSDLVLPLATHQGKVRIGELDLDCYVLEDGRRVFNKRGMAKALGMKSAGGNVFLRAMHSKGLGSEIDQKLFDRINNPFYFKPLTLDHAHGYEADILVDVCKAVVRAFDAKKLQQSQDGLAAQAKILLNAFAKIGITALVDEATGFQEIRMPDALQLLVQQYIEDEKREWAKQFPDNYYDELNRLYDSKRMTVTKSGKVVQNRPQHFAHFTRTYVYHPLENGAVLAELDKLNPKIGTKGTRRHRFHQHLTFEYGIEKLKRQVQDVMTLMMVSDNTSQFKKLYKKRFPQKGEQLDLLED